MKRHKKYQGPKYTAVDPLKIFGNISAVYAGDLQKLKIKNHGALAALAMGHANADHITALVDAVDIGLVLCDQGIGLELISRIADARTVLQLVRYRPKLLLRGGEALIIGDALDCFDAQLENIRAIDIERAVNATIQRRAALK